MISLFFIICYFMFCEAIVGYKNVQFIQNVDYIEFVNQNRLLTFIFFGPLQKRSNFRGKEH